MDHIEKLLEQQQMFRCAKCGTDHDAIEAPFAEMLSEDGFGGIAEVDEAPVDFVPAFAHPLELSR